MSTPRARVVVDVMLKPEILDPQGKAVHGAFGRLGFDGVADVRQGKRFEITLDGEATEERVAEMARAVMVPLPVAALRTGCRCKSIEGLGDNFVIRIKIDGSSLGFVLEGYRGRDRKRGPRQERIGLVIYYLVTDGRCRVIGVCR